MSGLAHKLNAVETYAKATRLGRLLHNPIRYVRGMFLGKVMYPFTHKGTLQYAPLFFGGGMQVLLPAAMDIYLAGGKTHDSEIRLARFMMRHLQPGDTYLDIGAHFGYFSLLASALVGEQGRVFSIEASKATYALLRQNVSKRKNIDVRHNAVSDKSGTVTFFEFPVLYSEYNSLYIEKFRHEGWIQKYKPQNIEVPAVTIDMLVQEHQLQPSVVKIDVEGAEVQAINGGEKTWQQGNSTIVLEYLDEGEDSTYGKAADILYGHGYASYIIDGDGGLAPVGEILPFMRSRNMTSENVVFKKV